MGSGRITSMHGLLVGSLSLSTLGSESIGRNDLRTRFCCGKRLNATGILFGLQRIFCFQQNVELKLLLLQRILKRGTEIIVNTWHIKIIMTYSDFCYIVLLHHTRHFIHSAYPIIYQST